MVDLSTYEHPSWLTVASTLGSYLLVLTAMFLLLFVVPFGLFTLFG